MHGLFLPGAILSYSDASGEYASVVIRVGASTFDSPVASLPDLKLFHAQRVDPDSGRIRRLQGIQTAFHPQGLSCESSPIL